MILDTTLGTFNVTWSGEGSTYWFTVHEPMKIGHQDIPKYTWFATNGVDKVGWGLFELDSQYRDTVTEIFLSLARALTDDQKRELRIESLTLRKKVNTKEERRLAKKLKKVQQQYDDVVKRLALVDGELKELTS